MIDKIDVVAIAEKNGASLETIENLKKIEDRIGKMFDAAPKCFDLLSRSKFIQGFLNNHSRFSNDNPR